MSVSGNGDESVYSVHERERERVNERERACARASVLSLPRIRGQDRIFRFYFFFLLFFRSSIVFVLVSRLHNIRSALRFEAL